MAHYLQHSAADITRYALIQLGKGTLLGANQAWPIGVDSEPNKPDNALTVYDTAGTGQGRLMVNGELQGLYGVQIRCRAVDFATGWAKLDEIQRTLAESVLLYPVAIGVSRYLIQCFSLVGDVLRLGKEQGGKRSLFTLNSQVCVKQRA